MEKHWCIRNVNDHGLMWSNWWGWLEGEDQSFDVFTDKEKEVLTLPLEGEWHEW